MNIRVARITCVVVLGFIVTILALQLPALAQDKTPPTPVAKDGTPTPPQKQVDAPSSPTGGGSPDYSLSTFTARGTHPGETITYTLVISNRGTNPGAATIANISVPTNATYVPGSAQAQGGGVVNVSGPTIQWSGNVNNGQSVTITFRVVLPNSIGTLVQATATIYDPGLVAVVPLKNSLTTQAPSGGPDALGYTYKDSFAPGGPTFSWVPTTPASIKLNFPGADDAFTGPITIGFAFKLYTGTYTTTFVGTNGFLSFGAGSNDNTPTPIPTIGDLDNYVGCFWADLYIQNAAQGVWVETFGSAPNRYTVFTYRIQYFPTSLLPDPPGLWQAILYETSNKIKCQYQSLPGPIYASGSESAIGLENYNGTVGLAYFFDGSYSGRVIGPLEDNLAIEFTPGAATYPVYVTSKMSASYNVHPGDVATYTIVARNTGTANGAATQMLDPIPANTTYVPGSAQVTGGGTLSANALQVSWTGAIPTGQSITITFRVQLTTLLNTVITNTATITDPQATTPVILADNSLKVQPKPIGGPDDFGYTYKDSYAPGGPAFNWVPTSTNSFTVNFGTLPADDIASGPITIGFPLNFYTGVYTQFFVSTNGLVGFGSTSPNNINYPIPTPGDGAANFASCFWSDLYINNAAQGIWIERFGSAPNRFTVITFRTTYFADINAIPGLFQMILSETSNTIKCQYKETPGPIFASAGGSTIGLENADETSGIQYYFGPAYATSVGPLEPGLAILFTPGPAVPSFAGSNKSVSAGTHPNEVITYTIRAYNNGTAPSTITSLNDPTPGGAVYVPGSAQVQGGGLLNANAAAVHWSGTVVNTQRVTITYRVTLSALSGYVTNTVSITDPLATKTTTQAATTVIQPYSGLGSAGSTLRYFYKDSYSPGGSVTYSWVPTSGASSKLTLLPDDDDGYNIVPISFTYRFDGRNYVNTIVSANGLVMFNDGVGSGAFNNQPIPTSGTVDSYATCFWDDQIAANAAQGIWYETFGSAPNRFTAITFVLSDTTSSPTKPYQYQMLLYEGSNRIKCQYNDMSGSINGDGRHATIGVENRWGDGGVQYFYGDDDYPYYGPIENNLAIVFEPAKTIYLPLALKNY